MSEFTQEMRRRRVHQQVTALLAISSNGRHFTLSELSYNLSHWPEALTAMLTEADVILPDGRKYDGHIGHQTLKILLDPVLLA